MSRFKAARLFPEPKPAMRCPVETVALLSTLAAAAAPNATPQEKDQPDLRMSHKTFDHTTDTLKTFVFKLLYESPAPLLPVVTMEKQRNEVELLKETIGSERFFFVVDLPSYEITEAYGLKKWLGYSEESFTMKQYWDYVVHPSTRVVSHFLAQTLYEYLCKGNYKLQFMVQRFSSLMALRHRKGHYLLVKRTSSVFQYDRQNRLMQHLNEFTIVGDYKGEPLYTGPRMFLADGERKHYNEKELMELALQKFLALKLYSPRELQMARKICYGPRLTRQHLAEVFTVSIPTVDTIMGRFLNKTRKFFYKTELDLPTALSAALFLREEGLL